MGNVPAKGGRPTKYKDEYAEQAGKLCQYGATDIEIADFFGVALSTFYLWSSKHAQFSEAIKVGKASADERVERSLFQKAVGYTFESEKIFTYEGDPIRVPCREHVPPSDTACIFWLKNRRPDLWRDRKSIEGAEGGDITVVLKRFGEGDLPDD